METKEKIILSVIISTYNRAALVCKNLKRMLKCRSDEIEFIVGDNASSDGTLEELNQISDPRLRIYSNQENYGTWNFGLLAYHARGKYFIYVNDRDYIEPKDLDEVCKELHMVKKCDFISNERIAYKKGYYTGKHIARIFFKSRHPGTIIYRTNFYKKNVDKNTLLAMALKEGEYRKKDYFYLTFEVTYNAKRVYVSKKYLIKQPPNREKIAKNRNEVWGEVYISPKSKIREFIAFMEQSKEWEECTRVNDIILAKYEDLFRTVTWEYYYCLKIDGFAERNNYLGHSSKEWFRNGLVFVKDVLSSGEMHNKRVLISIIWLTIKGFFDAAYQILKRTWKIYLIKNYG